MRTRTSFKLLADRIYQVLSSPHYLICRASNLTSLPVLGTVILLRLLLKLAPPFHYSSDDVDEIAKTSLLWLPFLVFVFSRLWLARRNFQTMQKNAMDTFFATHLTLWVLAKVSSSLHPSLMHSLGSIHLSDSFLIQPTQCVFL